MRGKRVFVVMASALALAGSDVFAGATVLSGHTPKYTNTQLDLGAETAGKPVHLRIWLKMRRPSVLEQLAADVVNVRSSSHGQYLSKDEVENSFKPTADQAAKVQKYLQTNGLKNVKLSAGRRFIEADGTVADAQKLFQVQMHRFLVDKKIVTANTSDPVLDNEIAESVSYVGGLSTHSMRPMVAKQKDLDTGMEFRAVPLNLTAGGAKSSHLTACFSGTTTANFGTTGALPSASYTGTRYGASITAASPDLPPCGFGPAEIQKSYGMTDLYAHGLDGAGQTVVIVDAYGSPTAEADLMAFSQKYGLPAPQLSIHPMGPPIQGVWTKDQQGWAGETTLDIEYVHAMAPGAKIVLVEAKSPADDDLNAALAYALDNHLGNVISNSWSGNEGGEDQAGFAAFNTIAQTAVAQGVSMHFSSGDSGDMFEDLGFSDVGFPSSSPLVTSIGGTSLALNTDGSILFHAGWGTNGSRITDGATTADQGAGEQNPPLSPPVVLGKSGFVGGAGGGTSRVFPKPDWQRALPGTMRMEPDIAYLADPYTGVEVIESTFDDAGNPQPGNLALSTIGGTSLACPLFSGMWAIANQAHGSSLGQAAPLLYGLKGDAIIDVLPVSSPNNVTGVLTTKDGVAPLPALLLAHPETATPFVSALYNSPTSPFRWNVITFGTDSTLEVTPGWDNVTGLGIPNGAKFVQALK